MLLPLLKKGLQNAILKEFRFVHWNAPQMVRQIEAGQYDILDQTGSVILPDEWHTVAKPGVRITMKMRSSGKYGLYADFGFKLSDYPSNNGAKSGSD
jgi:hypothetical protein